MGSSLGSLVAEYRTKEKGPVLRLKRCIQFRPGRSIIDVRNCYFIHSLIVKTYYEISTKKICDSIILFSKHDAGNCVEKGVTRPIPSVLEVERPFTVSWARNHESQFGGGSRDVISESW